MPTPPIGTVKPWVIYKPGVTITHSQLAVAYKAMAAAKRWWEAAVGKKFVNFILYPDLLEVPAGIVATYDSNLLEGCAQSVEALGYPNRDVGAGIPLPYIWVFFAIGHGGFAGAVHHVNQVGLCAVSDACLAAILGDRAEAKSIISTTDSLLTSIGGQRGAVAHELMHGLGWGGHEDEGGLEISSGEYVHFPNVVLPSGFDTHIAQPEWAVFFRE